MTFNVTVPNAATSPGIFPAQNNTNFSRLKLLISGDHQFNDTLASTDGKHKQVTLITKADFVSSLPTGTGGMVYIRPQGSNNQLLYYNGSKTYLGGTILAAVNFNGTTTPPSIRSQYNVDSVERTGAGRYKIHFTRDAPDNNYIVQALAMAGVTSGTTRYGQIEGDTTYGNSVSTQFVKIEFKDSGASGTNVLCGCVTIVSVT